MEARDNSSWLLIYKVDPLASRSPHRMPPAPLGLVCIDAALARDTNHGVTGPSIEFCDAGVAAREETTLYGGVI